MFYDNFSKLCQLKGMTTSAVAEELGLSRAAVSKWKNGSIPQDRTVRDIAEYFGVDASDLKYNVFMSYSHKQDEDPEKIKRLTKSIAEEIDKDPNMTVVNLGGFMTDPVQPVPVYESVSAGFGSLARNEVVSYVPCVIHSITEAQETIGIKVHGDSMYPKIEDGDTIIVHKQTSVDSGTIAVVMVDGDEGLVKRVEYGADWIHLISINPMYPIMKFKGEDVLRVQVVGRVTRIIKDV